MATLEAALFYHLTNTAGTTPGLIGTRLYPLVLPQDPTYPALTYQVIEDIPPMAHDGPGDLFGALVQFDCYGASYSAAKTLARGLRADLNGKSGAIGAAGARVRLAGAFLQGMMDHHEPTTAVWRVMVEFLINYKEI
jgi:hypothetical protein